MAVSERLLFLLPTIWPHERTKKPVGLFSTDTCLFWGRGEFREHVLHAGATRFHGKYTFQWLLHWSIRIFLAQRAACVTQENATSVGN